MTARRVQFPTGLAAVTDNWTGLTFKWLLATNSWTPDETSDVFISDMAAFELTDASYSRQAVTTKSRAIALAAAVDQPGYLQYKCDPPTFGVISGGEVAAALVLAQFITTDADSPLVASYPALYTADGVTPANFNISANGAVTVSTLCPSDL